MGRQRAQLGRRGEDAAAAHVARLGWRVLERNWRPTDGQLRGELDLIALDGHTVVVCEVKTRSGQGAGPAVGGVTPRKLAQLRRLAGAWLTEHPTAAAVRIDVIGVLWPAAAVAPRIDHRRGV
jgi:putative endonuclease